MTVWDKAEPSTTQATWTVLRLAPIYGISYQEVSNNVESLGYEWYVCANSAKPQLTSVMAHVVAFEKNTNGEYQRHIQGDS